MEGKWEPGAEFKSSDLQQVTQPLWTSVPYTIIGVKWKPLAPSPVINKGTLRRHLERSCAHCRCGESSQASGVELCALAVRWVRAGIWNGAVHTVGSLGLASVSETHPRQCRTAGHLPRAPLCSCRWVTHPRPAFSELTLIVPPVSTPCVFSSSRPSFRSGQHKKYSHMPWWAPDALFRDLENDSGCNITGKRQDIAVYKFSETKRCKVK